MSKAFPARVHIILARDGVTGIAIRRGPAKEVCTVGWNREDDTFQLGQWFKGRIYERRCDLSPDGEYFIYFALNGKHQGEPRGSWTAISKAPYLKAIGFWADGGARCGGGLFTGERTFWHNRHPYSLSSDLDRSAPELERSTELPFPTCYGGECPGVYYVRLQRDGWTLVRQDDKGALFTKPLPAGWLLEKFAYATSTHPLGTGWYYDTHRLLHEGWKIELERPDWEWVDLDRERLVWIEKGVLYAAPFHGTDFSGGRVLHDFNGMNFKAIPAPY